ncbi:LPS-assembly protein LptD [Coxiella-like endosymbiont of Amblyomma americanum]|uniref:LPS-assembly protein LptD n=1 Tax=Coxiella-like endosymbiont of Amblyomma americanum TaxID=1987500 RepID=UPI000F89D8C0|nr:LPS assembly protein LptD [Coxiella-like endosymbiont of Amblyomma americanum]AUJ58711.1 hypothetical protein B1F76_01250 [Coxiella-like endosymbiont of Amblyomma americanum]
MSLRNLFIFAFFVIMSFSFQTSGVAMVNERKIIKTSSLSKEHHLTKSLLKKWSRYLFYKYTANILGWISVKNNHHFFCHGYFKDPLIANMSIHSSSDGKRSIIITTKGSAIFKNKGISVLKKNIVVTQLGRVLNADKACVCRDEKTGKINKILLFQNIFLREPDKLIIADKGELTLCSKIVTLKNAAYCLHNNDKRLHALTNAWGTAKCIIQDTSSLITTLRYATYSTCSPTNSVWWFSATTLVLNKKIHQGKAYNVLLWFYNFPIFYFPYYSFPIDHCRKTGFLIPHIGLNNNSGRFFSIPFYWKVAYNYDLTLIPEFMTRRGPAINIFFQFLNKMSKGSIRVNYLFNDIFFQKFRKSSANTVSNPMYTNNPLYVFYINQLKNMKNQRKFFSIRMYTIFNSRWSSKIIMNYVTDPYYFQDLDEKIITNPLSNQLLNRISLQYNGLHWQFNGMLQAYQTLHPISQIFDSALDQYTRLPDIDFNGYYPNIIPYIDFNFNAEATNFNYRNSNKDYISKPIGQRFHMRTGLDFPFYFSLGHVTSQILVDTTIYHIQYSHLRKMQTISRFLPIFDINLLLYLYRDFNFWKYNLVQTFEPHVFYLYIPYQNQDKIPNFDTTLLPFSFEQLFALNRYTGDDRLQNANQISFGVTSHIFIAETPLLIINLGFTYLIEKKNVLFSIRDLLSRCNFHFSPIVGELTFCPSSSWSLTSRVAWNPNIQQTNNSSSEITYSNKGHKITAGYTFVCKNDQSVTHTNSTISVSQDNAHNHNSNTRASIAYLSMTWPLSVRWSITSHLDYNISYHHTDIAFVGVQYNTCCWVLSFLTKRTYRSSVNIYSKDNYSTTYLIQLELKGLSSFKNETLF